MVKKQLVEYLDRINFFYPFQYGFRSNLNVPDAILDIVVKLQDSLDKGQIAAGLFLDIRKAFDSINIGLLLRKLRAIEIGGTVLSWFEDYLSNRTQCVCNGKVRSTPGDIKAGVPQGSLLGPILFLIFINDLSQLKLDGHLTLFADDTSLFYVNDSQEEISRAITKDYGKIQSWLLKNGLKLNTQKTEYRHNL